MRAISIEYLYTCLITFEILHLSKPFYVCFIVHDYVYLSITTLIVLIIFMRILNFLNAAIDNESKTFETYAVVWAQTPYFVFEVSHGVARNLICQFFRKTISRSGSRPESEKSLKNIFRLFKVCISTKII